VPLPIPPPVESNFIGERRPLYDVDGFLSMARPGSPIGEACSERGLSEAPMPVGGFFDESVASPGKPTAPRWPRRVDGEACIVVERVRDTAGWVELFSCRETGLGPALPLIAS
jgi:hypothetical protein